MQKVTQDERPYKSTGKVLEENCTEFQWAPQVIRPDLCPDSDLQSDNKLRVFLKKNREQGSMTQRIHKLER